MGADVYYTYLHSFFCAVAAFAVCCNLSYFYLLCLRFFIVFYFHRAKCMKNDFDGSRSAFSSLLDGRREGSSMCLTIQ